MKVFNYSLRILCNGFGHRVWLCQSRCSQSRVLDICAFLRRGQGYSVFRWNLKLGISYEQLGSPKTCFAYLTHTEPPSHRTRIFTFIHSYSYLHTMFFCLHCLCFCLHPSVSYPIVFTWSLGCPWLLCLYVLKVEGNATVFVKCSYVLNKLYLNQFVEHNLIQLLNQMLCGTFWQAFLLSI